MKMLTKQQILLLHSQMILQFGGSDGIRDEAMLDSAINQPFTLTYLTKKNKCSFGWRRFMAVPSGTAFFMPILGKEQTWRKCWEVRDGFTVRQIQRIT